MLLGLKEIKGYKIRATDGDLGHVHDFYFDDTSWRLRFIVVDTGGWLFGRKVLIAPPALGSPDGTEKVIPARLTQEQVRNSPDVSTELPVSKQSVATVFDYYGWPGYWEPAFMPGSPIPVSTPPEEGHGDPHLRSYNDVKGYSIEAADGDIGHAEDVVIDDEGWVIRYLVIDTKLIGGREVIVTIDAVKEVSWPDRSLKLDHSKAEIESSPEYDPLTPLERDKEQRIFTHYRRRPYWII
jgi:hypothetical protein